jgi:type II secretory pathway pseudopilin PulG
MDFGHVLRPLQSADRRRLVGLTLTELVVVLAIAASLAIIAGASLMESKARSEVLACAQGLARDIRLGRRMGVARGERTLVIISRSEVPTNVSGDGGRRNPGSVEYYAVGLDANRDGGLAIPRRDILVKQGTLGDPLCAEGITIDRGTTIPGRKLLFSATGTLVNAGAANSNVYFKKWGQVSRVEVTSITGKTKIYVNMPDYKNCNGVDCRPSSSCSIPGGCWKEIL